MGHCARGRARTPFPLVSHPPSAYWPRSTPILLRRSRCCASQSYGAGARKALGMV